MRFAFLFLLLPLLVLGCNTPTLDGGANPISQVAARTAAPQENCNLARSPSGLRYEISSATGTRPYRLPDSAVDACGRRTFDAVDGQQAAPHDGLTPGTDATPGRRFTHTIRMGQVTRNTSCEILQPGEATVPAGTFSGLLVIRCNDQRSDRPLGRTVTTWMDTSTRAIIKREMEWFGSEPGSRSEVLLEAPSWLRPMS